MKAQTGSARRRFSPSTRSAKAPARPPSGPRRPPAGRGSASFRARSRDFDASRPEGGLRLNRQLIDVLDAVLRKSDTIPADAALRTVLREAKLEPGQRAFVSKTAFAYFRWLGWIEPQEPLHRRLFQAIELAERFEKEPRSFDDDELVHRSFPDWTPQFLRVNSALARAWQTPPTLWLRARPGLGVALGLPEAQEHPTIPDAWSYEGEADLFRTPQFQEGQFEIQDLSSQIVGWVCAPQPGETWWDACAGEGGKTLHLCGLMNNRGQVWASDPAEWRLKILQRRAARAKIFNFRTVRWVNQDHLPTRGKFDGILVDAPCSGLGTWGRNPQARWTTRPEDIDRLASLQRLLLDQVCGSLKPGGRLLYAVCTLARPETADVAEYFQATHPSFEPAQLWNPASGHRPQTQLELLPQAWQANGMFIAGWTKTGARPS